MLTLVLIQHEASSVNVDSSFSVLTSLFRVLGELLNQRQFLRLFRYFWFEMNMQGSNFTLESINTRQPVFSFIINSNYEWPIRRKTHCLNNTHFAVYIYITKLCLTRLQKKLQIKNITYLHKVKSPELTFKLINLSPTSWYLAKARSPGHCIAKIHPSLTSR